MTDQDTPDITKPGTDVELAEGAGPPIRFADRDWPYQWMGEFLDALALVPNALLASQAAHVARSWVYAVRAENAEFAAAWEDAVAQGIERLEAHGEGWARQGIPVTTTTTKRDATGALIEETVQVTRNISPTLLMFFLKKHKPEYRERFGIEHTGKDGGPINITVEEKLREAVTGFDASVVRLADASEPRSASG